MKKIQNPLYEHRRTFKGILASDTPEKAAYSAYDEIEDHYHFDSDPEAYFGEDAIDMPLLADYPVIVSVDVQGLEKQPDPYLLGRIHLEEAVRYDELDHDFEVMSDEELLGVDLEEVILAFENRLMEEEYEPITDADDALFLSAFGFIANPFLILRDILQGMGNEEFLVFIRERHWEDPIYLSAIAGRFHFKHGIPESRVVAVDYMKPIWPVVMEEWWNMGESRKWKRIGKWVEFAEKKGWDFITEEDINNYNVGIATRQVYAIEPPEGAEILYVGTTYLKLLKYAPHLGGRLPHPPIPYQYADELVDEQRKRWIEETEEMLYENPKRIYRKLKT